MNMNSRAISAVAGRSAGRSQPTISFGVTLAFGIVFFLVAGLFHVWSRISVIEQGYEISRQQQRREALLQDRRALSLELARLRDPSRLERYAASAGFSRPEPGQVFILEEPR